MGPGHQVPTSPLLSAEDLWSGVNRAIQGSAKGACCWQGSRPSRSSLTFAVDAGSPGRGPGSLELSHPGWLVLCPGVPSQSSLCWLQNFPARTRVWGEAPATQDQVSPAHQPDPESHREPLELLQTLQLRGRTGILGTRNSRRSCKWASRGP